MPMRRSRKVLAVPALLVVAASCHTKLDCSGSGPTITTSTSSSPKPGGPVEDVSLVQLIASPIKHQGQNVRVIGYVKLEFEGTAIYLHQEDFSQGLTKNALWLDMTRPDGGASGFEGYAVVEGTFDSTKHGHMGLFSGAIEQVTRLDRWRPPR